MELIEFLKNVDFSKARVSLHVGETEIFSTNYYWDDKMPVIITEPVNGFITIEQGGNSATFRPEAITFLNTSEIKYDANGSRL